MTTATSPTPNFAALLQEFFVQRLRAQRNASPRTIASYRDAFRLLLRFIQATRRKSPTALTLTDFDAPLVLGFLDHLERVRRNTIRSRNARLAAIRSFLHYAALRDPTALPTIQRVLAIPMKRCDRPLLGFLSREEITAILAAPDRATWSGQRDHVLFATLYNTGARVSEIVGARVADLTLARPAFLHLRGKGRKERQVPLWPSTAAELTAWLPRIAREPDAPVFPNRTGRPLSRAGVAHRLQRAVATAAAACPTLKRRPISPHTFRHTTAMHLLQAGVDITVIALWLGHESPVTTHLYVEADLALKRRALDRLAEPPSRRPRHAVGDRLLAFLDTL
jgi:integrase/recombinase XerD